MIPRLVIIEDDDEVLQMLQLHLSMLEVEAISFTEPLSAFDYIQKHITNIDGILSDLNLSPITGIDLLEKTRSLSASLPFFLMSGNASKEAQEAAVNLKVTGILKKTTMLSQLSHIVESISHS